MFRDDGARLSLFAEHVLEGRRTKLGDTLVGLAEHADFKALAAGVERSGTETVAS